MSANQNIFPDVGTTSPASSVSITGDSVGLARFAQQSLTAKYQVADTDTLNLVKYYGFTDKDGNWYILREDKSVAPTEYRYANASNNGGPPDYETATTGAWDDRANLTYDYFHNLTGV